MKIESESSAFETISSTEKKWCWKSSIQTVEERKISILALIETLIAMIIYGLIAITYGTFHLTIAAIITPFLLLRSEKSTELGLSIAKRIVASLKKPIPEEFVGKHGVGHFKGKFERPLRLRSIIYLIGSYFTYIFLLPAIRISVTIYVVFRHPIYSLQQVPDNWWRIVACVDSFQPPEPIPGIEFTDTTEHLCMLKTSTIIPAILNRGTKVKTPSLYRVTLISFYILTLVLPALIYRFALKGTASLWSPLLWIVKSSVNKKAIDILDEVKVLTANYIIRLYSVFVIAAFASKLIVFSYLKQPSIEWKNTKGGEIVYAFLAPNEIPIWHIAAIINALLAWLVFFMADYILLRYSKNDHKKEEILEDTIKLTLVIRKILSIYTIVVMIYIAASLEWKLPPIGTNFFPRGMFD